MMYRSTSGRSQHHSCRKINIARKVAGIVETDQLLVHALMTGKVVPGQTYTRRNQSIPNELYLGRDAASIGSIAAWLNKERKKTLDKNTVLDSVARIRGASSNARLATVSTLDELLNSEDLCRAAGIDPVLFAKNAEVITAHLQSLDRRFKPAPSSRYLVGTLTEESLDSGGFHSALGIGYQYISDFAYSTLLKNEEGFPPELRTMELLRNYFHDSCHMTTFRTFRLVEPGQNSRDGWPLYRHQYGINFRRADGISYSAALSDKIPYSINLNLLMDGIISLEVAQAVEKCGLVDPKKYAERSAANDIALDLTGNFSHVTQDSQIAKFNRGVTAPTQTFLEFWGPETTKAVFHSMFSGKLTPVLSHFHKQAKSLLSTDSAFQRYVLERSELLKIAYPHQVGPTPGQLWLILFKSTDY